MTKNEVLTLALEALEEIHVGNMTPMAEINWNKAITAIKEALAQPERLAELGWQEIECPICGGGARAFPKPKQEPVAWMHAMDNTEGHKANKPYVLFTKSKRNPFGVAGRDYSKSYPVTKQPLYTTPPPCPTCEALARTVMLDQTGRDA